MKGLATQLRHRMRISAECTWPYWIKYANEIKDPELTAKIIRVRDSVRDVVSYLNSKLDG